IAGIATALKVYNKMDEIGATEFAPLMGFGLPAIAGAFVGFATNKLTKNLTSYADEKKAYTHQGVVSAAFNPTASTPDALKRNKKDLLEKRGFTEQTFDVLFRKGYPSETTRKLWIQNGKMLAHEAGLTQPGKLNNYIASADKNIRTRQYKFNES